MFKRNVFTTKHIVQLGQHIQKIQNLDAALSNTTILTFCLVYTVQATSVLTKASVWYEMRVFWAIINHVKSHAMALAFILQTDIN